jgi:iron complex transport system ATP-binding protein
VVIVSHDIDLIAQYCNRVILLKDGTIFKTGQPDDVITAENIEEVYECPVLVDFNPLSGRPRVSVK